MANKRLAKKRAKQEAANKLAKEVEVKVEEPVVEKAPTAKGTRKPAVKVSVVVQAAGKELTETEVYERVTEDWCKAGNDKADIKTMAVYVKPEESAIYYVINGDVTGRVDF